MLLLHILQKELETETAKLRKSEKEKLEAMEAQKTLEEELDKKMETVREREVILFACMMTHVGVQ